MSHQNAEILMGMARGQRVLARFSPHGSDFVPLECQPSSALHALFKPAPGLELQGKWEFKLIDESEELPC